METYSAAQRRALAEGMEADVIPPCPECGAELAVREVEPSRQVSYVRRRVWLICPGCKRTAALDVTAGEPPSGRPDHRS